MTGYEWALNKALKAHDKSLYVRICKDGIWRVFQRVKQWRTHHIDGATLLEQYDADWLICPLTHNWAANGTPVEWGIEPVIDHIKYGRPEYIQKRNEELEKQAAQSSQSRARNLKSVAVDAAEDMYDGAKKGWSDIRYANMDKTNDVRKKWDTRRKLNGIS